jgi:hypothetical protein
MMSEPELIRKNNPSPNTGREPDDETGQTKPDIPPSSSVPEFPPTKTHCQITCKAEKNWWDKVKPIVEIAGIVLLGVYTVYTIKMYRANKEAADAAQESAAAAKLAAETTYAELFLNKAASKDTLTQMQAQTGAQQDAANAAKSAADTAAAALKLSDRAFRAEERAYVLMTHVEIEQEPGPGVPIKLRIKFSNVGRTPGLKFGAVLWHQVGLEFSESIRYGFAGPPEKLATSQTVMPPNEPSPYFLHDSALLSSAELDAIKAEGSSAKFFVWGYFGYEDIFGWHHGGTFCEWYRPDSAKPNFCRAFNEFDVKEAEYKAFEKNSKQ